VADLLNGGLRKLYTYSRSRTNISNCDPKISNCDPPDLDLAVPMSDRFPRLNNTVSCVTGADVHAADSRGRAPIHYAQSRINHMAARGERNIDAMLDVCGGEGGGISNTIWATVLWITQSIGSFAVDHCAPKPASSGPFAIIASPAVRIALVR
jgi:hypothetical protein